MILNEGIRGNFRNKIKKYYAVITKNKKCVSKFAYSPNLSSKNITIDILYVKN
jgi:hypothetical protein